MKKMSAGAWITCAAVLLAVIAFFVYNGNISAEGYYNGAAVANLPLMVLGAALCLVAAVALNMAGKGKAIELLSGLLRIAAPALLAWALINLVAGRVDGLGYIYFSNTDVAKEVQTAANLSSATGAITSMALLGAAMFFGVVSAFFSLRKKDA